MTRRVCACARKRPDLYGRIIFDKIPLSFGERDCVSRERGFTRQECKQGRAPAYVQGRAPALKKLNATVTACKQAELRKQKNYETLWAAERGCPRLLQLARDGVGPPPSERQHTCVESLFALTGGGFPGPRFARGKVGPPPAPTG